MLFQTPPIFDNPVSQIIERALVRTRSPKDVLEAWARCFLAASSTSCASRNLSSVVSVRANMAANDPPTTCDVCANSDSKVLEEASGRNREPPPREGSSRDVLWVKARCSSRRKRRKGKEGFMDRGEGDSGCWEQLLSGQVSCWRLRVTVPHLLDKQAMTLAKEC